MVALSDAIKRPGLVGELAIDSLGTLLCPIATGTMAALNPLAEKFRVFVMEDSYDDPSREATDELPELPTQLGHVERTRRRRRGRIRL